MAIVNNTGQNFTLYYNVLNYFKTISANHPQIRFSTQGDVFSVDEREFPAYPLSNILITNAVFTDKSTIYTCQLTVADKVKVLANRSVGDTNSQTIPFYDVDDVVDIHANTLAIMNDLTSYTQYSQQAFEVSGDTNCTPFRDTFDNGLAGWVATFDLEVHNDRPRCLYELNP